MGLKIMINNELCRNIHFEFYSNCGIRLGERVLWFIM
jgi:hypothetical protein